MRRWVGAHGPQKQIEVLPLIAVRLLKDNIFGDDDVELVAGSNFQRRFDVQVLLQELECSLTELRSQRRAHFILERGVVAVAAAV